MLAVGQRMLGKDDPSLVRAVGAFGGGIASSGNVCGAMLGGVAFLSSLFSKSTTDEADSPLMWKLSSRFTRKFREITEEHGGINCSEIARIDWRDKEKVKKFYNDPESRRSVCVQVVGDAAYALGEILLENPTA